MSKIELLVPAGNMDAFKAAIKNGADAIYLGGKNFGARAFANNFDHDELTLAIKLAHLNGVKVYVTMNTMLSEDEILPALNEAEFLHSIGVDALIVQDLGLVSECRKRFPNLELHASTQMHIHNLSSAKFITEHGVKRVVMARESSLETIKSVTKEKIEVEVFAHGALCISYSGQCLMSSALFSRSGNKGTCAQCCRLQYRLYDQNTEEYIDSTNEYLLSPKDLNLLDKIPDLINAKVASIKIEGRMKRPEYVGLVTRLYRRAIDAYYNNEKFEVNQKMIEDLKLMFNRGFTHGHIYNESSKNIYNQNRPNHLGIIIGKVVKSNKNQIFIKLEKELNQGDGLRIISGNEEFGIVANKIYKNDLLVNSAKSNDIVAFDMNKFIKVNSIVLKTTDVNLLKDINNFDFYRKVPITMNFEACIGHPFKLNIICDDIKICEESKFILEAAKKAPLSKEKISDLLQRTNDSAFSVIKIDGVVEDVFAPVKVINEVRRIAIDKLTKIKEEQKVEFIKKDSFNLDNDFKLLPKNIFEIQNEYQYEVLKSINDSLFITSNLDLANKYQLYYLNPNVNEDGLYHNYNLNVSSELGSLNISNIVSSNLNIANSYALEFILNNHIDGVILSTELNDIQIENLIKSYYKRYNKKPNVYRYLYGKRDLMYLKKSFIDHEINNDIDETHHFDLVDVKDRHFNTYIDGKGLTHILEDEFNIKDSTTLCGNYIRLTNENKNQVQKLKTILNELL